MSGFDVSLGCVAFKKNVMAVLCVFNYFILSCKLPCEAIKLK